jgi:hypothetical protein
VIFSYAPSSIIELEIKKALATAGAFLSLALLAARKSFAGKNLAVSLMVA